MNPDTQPLPANQKRVELSDGTNVVVRTPGILFEERVFGQFPDLVQYHVDRQALGDQVDAGEATKAELDKQRDLALEWRVSIELVCACSVRPRLVEKNPGENERAVDDLDTRDFWKIASACNELWQETRKTEAAEIGPFSRKADGAG